MKLSPRATAGLANAIAHALGLEDPSSNGAILSFDEPRSPRAIDALYTRLGAALDGKRPSKHAPSIGQLIAILVSSKGGGPSRHWPPPAALRPGRAKDSPRRALAELIELVAQGSFERTKRAERARVLGELLLLFDLESLLDVELEPGTDVEEALRRVRRALAAR